MPSAAYSAVEISTSSISAFAVVSGIDTVLYEAAWLGVGGWVNSCKQHRRIFGFLEKCVIVWWPVDFDLCLQLYIWLRDLVL